MPLQATSGAASYDAFGGGVPFVPTYIEDVFSTWLYTGTGATQTINNGIDLAGKGGLTINKTRSVAGFPFVWFDSTRSLANWLRSDSTNAQASNSSLLTSFNSNGFTVGTSNTTNDPGITYASWTFREQPKFFDVVTYTGNGTSQNIAHNLGSVPGCFIVKATSTTGNWAVYHRSLPQVLVNDAYIRLNQTAAAGSDTSYWNNVLPTSTTFTVGSHPDVNTNGVTYVAYLFAHNAGGFGLTGTDNVISCGSYTGNGSTSGPEINLGYEPQWVLIKNASATGFWFVFDNMRGIATGGTDALLFPNASDAEANSTDNIDLTATGFRIKNSAGSINGNGNTLIYIAIRRGPMRTPTTGTSVFEPVTSTSANFVRGTIDASDMGLFKDRTTTANWFVADRLRGIMNYFNPTIYTNLTNAEATPGSGDTVTSASSEGTGNGRIYFGGSGTSSDQPLGYSFKRAPGFMDVCCYTGNGTTQSVSHNLGVAPELMIVKRRNTSGSWVSYNSASGAGKYLVLNSFNADTSDTAPWNNTAPTASVFTVGTGGGAFTATNVSGSTYVNYLFASCPGVSKVGSYTGNGSIQTINCGFTGGARFVLIKSSSAAGHWRVYDTARGIVAGNEPELFLNINDAEQTVYDALDPDPSGFIVNTNSADINTNGVTYIFLAIA